LHEKESDDATKNKEGLLLLPHDKKDFSPTTIAKKGRMNHSPKGGPVFLEEKKRTGERPHDQQKSGRRLHHRGKKKKKIKRTASLTKENNRITPTLRETARRVRKTRSSGEIDEEKGRTLEGEKARSVAEKKKKNNDTPVHRGEKGEESGKNDTLSKPDRTGEGARAQKAEEHDQDVFA